MDDDVAARKAIDMLLPERLWRMQRVTGVPVVFGGITRPVADGRELVLTRLAGTLGECLRGVIIPSGRGLGGVVLRDGTAHTVSDYATATTISHEYDHIAVGQERLRSVFAVPVKVDGAIRAVMFGADRDASSIGDRTLGAATVVATQLEADAARLLESAARHGYLNGQALDGRSPVAGSPRGGAPRDDARIALAKLASLIPAVPDPELRDQLARVHQALGGTGALVPGAGPQVACSRLAMHGADKLAPRELDVLRMAAVGASNLEIAARLGLRPETVKAYMRAAMRKLGARNRIAAVHAARLADAL